ncbi:TAXI family TRAP transporter solute-binding subunit [Mangrovicoccus algicola]|uniref:TAXI family TRAP transporter solute-binding subunit n=1 Tax=Mangrovicoccus algicola TaxID=2771008 RepID=A0A8J7CW87_9RHOB|nr:TAXI family TRAP transporter solute-binding subunit [Mangrovicoccus algicola]MBE3639629.1 TAXI family TRAP transporter solute-binding subunit [Mangrovicoccus algicola]
MKTILATALIGAAGLAASTASAANITLCGASPGGLWSLIGVGLDAAVRAQQPDSTVTYQTSSGGFANIAQIKAGGCDLGIVHVGEALIAKKGAAPFQAPVEGIGAVALVYDKAPMHFLVSKSFAEEYGLGSIADLATSGAPLDLVSNRRGILPSILLEEAFAKSGLTYDQLEENGGSVQYEGSAGAADIMTDGRADMWTNATFIGTSAVETIAQARPMTLLSVPAEVSRQMVEEYGSQLVTIPAGSYPWLDHDVETFGARAAIVAAEDADPAMIELVATAIRDHADKIAEVHSAMGGFTAEFAASLDALDYVPGAAEIYAPAN